MNETTNTEDRTDAGGHRLTSGGLLDCDPNKQYKLLKSKLGDTANWTAGENATYYSFFLHGWLGRSGDAEYQDRSGHPNTVLYQGASGTWYVAEPRTDPVVGVKINGKVYKAL